VVEPARNLAPAAGPGRPGRPRTTPLAGRGQWVAAMPQPPGGIQPPPCPGIRAGPKPQPQPAARAASPPTTRRNRGVSRPPSSPPTAPTPTMTAIRQGRVRVQAVHSPARIRRHCARAEPPGRPTLARTRTATTWNPALVPDSSSSRSLLTWARMACRSGLAALEHGLEPRRRCFALQPEGAGAGAVPAAWGLTVTGQVLLVVGGQLTSRLGCATTGPGCWPRRWPT
jgi:hypothetical protein